MKNSNILTVSILCFPLLCQQCAPIYIYADDNGPIANEEALIIEAPTKKSLPETTPPTEQKEILPTHEATVKVDKKALELPDTPTVTLPTLSLSQTTTQGSLELSSKPKWISPKDKLIINQAKIDPSSIESFDALAKGMTYCSWITRNNLQRITKMKDTDSVQGFDGKGILIGDAMTIIKQGLKANLFKEVYLDDGSIQKYLNRVERHTKATIFDIYIHHTKESRYFFAGHRITAFLGTDNQWYILDPVMIKPSPQTPILLTEYFSRYGLEGDRILILRTGYAPEGYEVTTYPMLAVKHFSELKTLRDREDIAVTSVNGMTTVAFNTDIRFLAEYTFVDIAAGTLMHINGSIDDLFSIGTAQGNDLYTSVLPWRVLGTRSQDITFSQPVKITLLAEYPDATPFTPLVVDQKGIYVPSITQEKHSICDEAGNVQDSGFPQAYSFQKSQAQFYSCHGGAFSLIPGIGLHIAVQEDGKNPFHEQSFDGSLYQGQDSNNKNLLVRAGDQVIYTVTVDGSKEIKNNQLLTFTLQSDQDNVKEQVRFMQLPIECGEGSVITPDGSKMVCDLSLSYIQSTLTLSVPVYIEKHASNNAMVTLKVSTPYHDVLLYEIAKSVRITNFFDNDILTKITETMKDSSNSLVAGVRELIGTTN